MPPLKRILLVNPEAKERENLVRHLERAGYFVLQVDEGALAINKAIQDPPDMIITNADMPLVDGFKFCQLLRTNPATRHIPFIFITEKETNPKKLGQFIRPDDDFILRPFKMEEILGRVHNLFYRLDKVQEVSAEVDRSVGGTLTEIALVDLLQIFKMNRKNGILTLKANNQSGSIYIKDGMVINAGLGKVYGEKALYRMITWQHGTFEFKPSQVSMEIKIQMPTENLIMEGIRQLDEMNRLKDNLLPKKASLRLKKVFKGPASKLRPVTRELFGLLEYFHLVEDLLDHSTFPDLEVYATLHALLDHDIIEIRGDSEAGVDRGRGPLLTLEEALKVGYYLGVGRREPNQQWIGKVLLFAQHPEHLETFLEKGTGIPEFARDVFEETPDSLENLCHTGIKAALTIMENITILMLHLPPAAGCEPLWRAFCHRAVGALVLAGDDGDRERVCKPVFDFLGQASIPFTAVALNASAPQEAAAAHLPSPASAAPASAQPESRTQPSPPEPAKGKRAGEHGPPAPVKWLDIDPADADFSRKALRSLFDAILSR